MLVFTSSYFYHVPCIAFQDGILEIIEASFISHCHRKPRVIHQHVYHVVFFTSNGVI